MDTSLLKAIRWLIAKEKKPAVVAARRHKGERLRLIKELLARRPFRSTPGTHWVCGWGAGTRRCAAFLGIEPTVVRRRAPYIAPPARFFRIYRQLRARHGETAVRVLRFLLEFSNARRLLDKNRPEALVLHSDYSELSLAFAIACNKAGVDVLFFQNSEGNRRPPLHRITTAYVYDPALADNGVVLTAQVPQRPLRPIPERPVIGVALNNYADREGVIRAAAALSRLPNSGVLIRRHPNSTEPLGIPECDPSEPLAAFLERCDLLVAGNTGVQAQALRFGVPVIHCGGLDHHPFDTYGLVSQGRVCAALSAEAISLDAARAFYSPNSARRERNSSTIA